ncbi:predicted protein [Histoplasma capsulatum G186AR]|uniref:Uncharacterized protein n=1 Tax=Ajellomyces capsulatus (strain G186AR / H82 / ATCC MYA-2454 / RMSCC 2432) TaxID=447093 RepID=C0NE07_AJECG|nr:uncharacterized protein HCBG_02100 [Histoplasma capsulatum G186AR]EEH10455.1 predicted protein [Histoplasma capsulatum G186AR]
MTNIINLTTQQTRTGSLREKAKRQEMWQAYWFYMYMYDMANERETAVETPWPKGVANHFLTHLPMEADLYNVRTRTGSELGGRKSKNESVYDAKRLDDDCGEGRWAEEESVVRIDAGSHKITVTAVQSTSAAIMLLKRLRLSAMYLGTDRPMQDPAFIIATS